MCVCVCVCMFVNALRNCYRLPVTGVNDCTQSWMKIFVSLRAL